MQIRRTSTNEMMVSDDNEICNLPNSVPSTGMMVNGDRMNDGE